MSDRVFIAAVVAAVVAGGAVGIEIHHSKTTTLGYSVPSCGAGYARTTDLSGCERAVAVRMRTVYYRVSAVNAKGEGPLSNEVAATVPAALADFRTFVLDAQAATYYGKWVVANPGDYGRWTRFRDAILAGTSPARPAMSSHYGAGLVDAGVLALDGLP